MTDTKGRPVAFVGPIDFEGPAVEREAKILEDNNHPPVDLDDWYATTLKHKAAMAEAEAELFAKLEGEQ